MTIHPSIIFFRTSNYKVKIIMLFLFILPCFGARDFRSRFIRAFITQSFLSWCRKNVFVEWKMCRPIICYSNWPINVGLFHCFVFGMSLPWFLLNLHTSILNLVEFFLFLLSVIDWTFHIEWCRLVFNWMTNFIFLFGRIQYTYIFIELRTSV